MVGLGYLASSPSDNSSNSHSEHEISELSTDNPPIIDKPLHPPNGSPKPSIRPSSLQEVQPIEPEKNIVENCHVLLGDNVKCDESTSQILLPLPFDRPLESSIFCHENICSPHKDIVLLFFPCFLFLFFARAARKLREIAIFFAFF